MAVEKKGITVKINAELHAEVRQFLDSHELTMAEFVTLALQDELRPKINLQEEKSMGNMRTLAFQVPEELFQRIKDYLQRNHMTQKEFVIGLIETEIERDLAQSKTQTVQRETTTVSVFEDVSNEDVETEDEKFNDEEAEDLDDEPSEDEESEDEDFDEDESESEDQGMSMGM